MIRIFDTVGMLVVATLLGAATWFIGAMVVGNITTVIAAPDAGIILFTIGIASLTTLLGLATLCALTGAGMFAVGYYPRFFDTDADGF